MTTEELDAIKYAFKEAIKPLRDEMNARFEALHEEMDSRFDALHEEMDSRFEALQGEMDSRFDKVEKRLDKLERGQKAIRADIRELKEDSEITRTTTNEIVKWLDTYHRKSSTPFPVESENSVPSLNTL